MRKGFTLTLMTVAIALVSVQAMAMAPTISDIPSPVVGGAEAVTGGSKFVYIDAFDIQPLASDDSTAQANLMWSFAIAGTPKYTINGIDSLNLASDDPTSPTTAKIINRTVAKKLGQQEWNIDGKASTLTIRNQSLSPLMPAPATNSTVTGSGVLTAETQLVTFFCSDGNAYSSKTVYFYTTTDGDRLSQVAWTEVKNDPMNMNATPKTWRFDTSDVFGATTSSNFSGSVGLCLVQPLGGDNWGSLITDYGYLQLVANKVYRIKLTMNSSQTVKDNAPLWDFVIANYVTSTQQGNNMYAYDQYVYAVGGGVNSIISSTNGTEMAFYWTPASVNNNFWTTTAFNATNAAGMNGMFRLRSFDLTTVGNGGTKSGSICIQKVVVETIDANKMVDDGAPIVNLTSFTQANASGTGNVNVKPLFTPLGTACTVAFSGGTITFSPKDGGGGLDGRTIEIMEVYPANDLLDGNYNSASGGDTNTYTDNWPIPWQDNKILKLEAGISAPSTADVAKPWDAIELGLEAIDDELIGTSYVTSARYAGGPQVGTPQPYIYLLNTNTMSLDSRMRRFKWQVRFINSPNANFPSNTLADVQNTGSVRLHSVKVSNVKFQ